MASTCWYSATDDSSTVLTKKKKKNSSAWLADRHRATLVCHQLTRKKQPAVRVSAVWPQKKRSDVSYYGKKKKKKVTSW